MHGRRRFLAGLGGVALSAGAANLLRPLAVRADGAEIPKRLLVITTTSGVIENLWRPTGSETEFLLPTMLEPLARHRARLNILGPTRTTSDPRDLVGVSVHVMQGSGRSQGHGWEKLLTGTVPRGGDDGEASSASVDQVIARRIQGGTPFPSLQLGIRTKVGNTRQGDGPAYGEGGVDLPHEDDPNAAFRRVFGTVGTPDTSADVARRRRRSVLDFTRGELGSLRARLGSVDRRLLDQHESAIRDIERSLASAPGVCSAPGGVGPVAPNGWDDYSNLPDVARMQREIACAALSCDLSRVIMLSFGKSASNARHGFLGGARTGEWHHELSHDVDAVDDDGGRSARDAFVAVGRWQAEQIALTLDRLEDAEQPDGSTLLDHTLVAWVNENSHSILHTHQNLPIVLAGSAGGAIRTGRYLQYDSEPHNNLLLSMCHAMGLTDMESFGDPRFCTGLLPRLLS